MPGDGPSATGFAPGKLLLSGEHAVVHGHPAVAVAVDRGTTVRLTEVTGPRTLDAPFHDDRLEAALSAVLPEAGLHVAIESDLPIGRGMGSSAALAIALVRARQALGGHPADFALLHREGFKVERIFHGQPSGVDHAVSALGGAVAYRKGADGPTIDPVGARPYMSRGGQDMVAALLGPACTDPAADLIDFRFGPGNSWWHTNEDTLEKCSQQSLQTIGTVVMSALPALEKAAIPRLKR